MNLLETKTMMDLNKWYSLFGSFEGKTKHVIDETLELKKSKGNKLRRGKKGGNVQSESDQVIKKKESLNGGEEEESDNDDEWKAASSYNSLLNSLKREGTSKYHTLFKKIKLEGEGKEEEITTLNGRVIYISFDELINVNNFNI